MTSGCRKNEKLVTNDRKPKHKMANPSGQPSAPDVSRRILNGTAVQNSAQIAQLVEQRIENPRVGGSIPSLGTTNILISL